MIRLNDKDAAIIAALAQYQKLPLQRKYALIEQLSFQANPIGLILIGESADDSSEEAIKIASEYCEWARKNRKKRNSKI